MLATLISLFGPISGAHFNPVVSAVAFHHRQIDGRTTALYVVTQIAGCCAGAMLANTMFELPAIQASTQVRSGGAQWLSELVATAGLILVAFRSPWIDAAAWRVAAWIGAAYWFTASTSFANPAITVGRSLSDTFAGIRPDDVPGFIGAQIAGAIVGVAVLRIFPAGEQQQSAARESLAALLNRDCDCTCTDLHDLHRRLDADLGEGASSQSIVDTHPHLFSETPVFLDPAEAHAMQRIVEAVETVVRLPGFQRAVIENAPPVARAPRRGTIGVFAGFDFHLSSPGPG